MIHQCCAVCRSPHPTVFCQADDAYLCTPCDNEIHSTNKLSSRHIRTPLQPPSFHQNVTHIPAHTTAHSFLEHSDASTAAVGESDPILDLLASNSNQPINFDDVLESFAPKRHQHSPRTLVQNTTSSLLSMTAAMAKRETNALLNNTPYSANAMMSNSNDQMWTAVQAVHQPHTLESSLSYTSSTASPSSPPTPPIDISSIFCQLPGIHQATTIKTTENNSTLQLEQSNPTVFNSKQRKAALERFRSKRANRSFKKRVRYECRKQLADSRPRIKGRFIGRKAIEAGVLHAM